MVRLETKPETRVICFRAAVLNGKEGHLPRAHLQCLETFLVMTGNGEVATSIQWADVKDVGKHPAEHRTAPTKRIIQRQQGQLHGLCPVQSPRSSPHACSEGSHTRFIACCHEILNNFIFECLIYE